MFVVCLPFRAIDVQLNSGFQMHCAKQTPPPPRVNEEMCHTGAFHGQEEQCNREGYTAMWNVA